MKSMRTLLIGAVAIGLPIAAVAQVTRPAEGPAQPGATQEPRQPATQPAEPKQSAAQPAPSNEPEQQAEPSTPSTQMKAATAADIKKDAAVSDQKGDPVGKVESVNADGVVVSTGTTRATIPLASFGLTEKGLVIALTRAELEAAAKKAKSK